MLLTKRHALEKMDLRSTSASPESLAAWAKMRGELLTLKVLGFSYNQTMLNDTLDGEALAALLMERPALEKLDLRSPGTTPEVDPILGPGESKRPFEPTPAGAWELAWALECSA